MIPETVGAPALVRAGRLPVGGNGRLGLGVAFAGSAHKAVDPHLVGSATALADAGLGPASDGQSRLLSKRRVLVASAKGSGAQRGARCDNRVAGTVRYMVSHTRSRLQLEGWWRMWGRLPRLRSRSGALVVLAQWSP